MKKLLQKAHALIFYSDYILRGEELPMAETDINSDGHTTYSRILSKTSPLHYENGNPSPWDNVALIVISVCIVSIVVIGIYFSFYYKPSL